MDHDADIYAPPAEEMAPPSSANELVDGPRGIGGWLVLPLLGLIVSPIQLGFALVTEYVPIFQNDWAVITDEAYALYHPLWGPLLVFETLATVALMLAALLGLVLMFRHDRRFPKVMIAIYATNLAYLTTDLLIASQIPALAGSDDPLVYRDVGRAVVAAVVWIPYFLTAKRVRNTFVA